MKENVLQSGFLIKEYYILLLVPSIYNIYKSQMLHYNWAILGDMFRPLNGHPQANLEQCC